MRCNFLEGKRTSIMEQVIELFLLIIRKQYFLLGTRDK